MPKKTKKVAKKAVKTAAKKPVKKVVKKKAVKPVAKKKVAKVAVKKATAVKKPAKAKVPAVKKAFNKSQITAAISDMTGASKKETTGMLDALYDIIAAHLKKRSGVGEFTFPGVAKFKVVNKPATKARKGTNPFTGEEMMFAAKPARNIVKIRALKKIKDAAK